MTKARARSFGISTSTPASRRYSRRNRGSYADPSAELEDKVTYSWSHSIGEGGDALISAGLSIDFLHEFAFSPRAAGRLWSLEMTACAV